MDDIQTTDRPTLADLSPAHQAFITGILQYMTPTRAYMQAYPESSYAAAISSASDLLTNPNIRLVLSSLLDARAMQANDIIDRLGAMGTVDYNDIIEMVNEPILDRHGDPVPLPGGGYAMRQVPHLREGALAKWGTLIKSIRPANGGGVTVETHDPQAALALLARIRRMITDAPPQINVEQVVIYMPDNTRDAPQVVEGKVKDA